MIHLYNYYYVQNAIKTTIKPLATYCMCEKFKEGEKFHSYIA